MGAADDVFPAFQVKLCHGVTGGVARRDAGLAQQEGGGGREILTMPGAGVGQKLPDRRQIPGPIGGNGDPRLARIAELPLEEGAKRREFLFERGLFDEPDFFGNRLQRVLLGIEDEKIVGARRGFGVSLAKVSDRALDDRMLREHPDGSQAVALDAVHLEAIEAGGISRQRERRFFRRGTADRETWQVRADRLTLGLRRQISGHDVMDLADDRLDGIEGFEILVDDLLDLPATGSVGVVTRRAQQQRGLGIVRRADPPDDVGGLVDIARGADQREDGVRIKSRPSRCAVTESFLEAGEAKLTGDRDAAGDGQRDDQREWAAAAGGEQHPAGQDDDARKEHP